MNVLFFLTPKALCSYLRADDTIRQAMERFEVSGYTALPVLAEDGSYCGTLTEGDLLLALRRLCVMDMRQAENHSIRELEPRRTVRSVGADAHVEDLLQIALEQNFVPVLDDKADFIGLVTRSRILRYFLQEAGNAGV